MDQIGKKITEMESQLEVADGLRKWQRQSKKKRGTLILLAQKLNTTADVLKNMMRRGPRKAARKANAKKKILEEGKKRCGFKKFRQIQKNRASVSAAAVRRDVLTPTCEVSPRTTRRLIEPLRKERITRYKKYWKKWHLKNPNRGITDDQFFSLNKFSQIW